MQKPGEPEDFSLIGIYGGTFDPVHCGHLRIAEELTDILQLHQLYFLPAGQPRLRNAPVASSQHRVAMLREAIRDNPRFTLDDREIQRAGETYSVESLREIRRERNDNERICFIIGSDAFSKLPGWHHWHELFELCHLVVTARPGYSLHADQSALSDELQQACRHRWTTEISALKNSASGLIFIASTILLDISSTRIRTLLGAEKSIRYLLPDNVLRYVSDHHLYAGGK